MKYAGILLPIYLLLPFFLFAQQGSSCLVPYVIPLDAACHDYSISSVSSSAVHCTNSIYSGTGNVTFFSFTSDASGSCVLINLTTSGNQPAEMLLYEGCSGAGNPQSLETSSSLCFDDGEGIWAPSETFSLSPNTTYYLRAWTPGGGTLTLCAKNYTPPNDDCAGATPIGPTPITDNNACAKPGPGVTPPQLCAFTLENTVFYKYIVEATGASLITISNIACDNSTIGATPGFQIGFFTGSCNSLTSINCYSDVGGTVSASTSSMAAGTEVIVAIDGMAGSNCSYTISAFNAVVMPVNLKYFTVWKQPNSNLLKWLTLSETDNSHFDIEKSTDGIHFSRIGTLQGKKNSTTESNYSFEDKLVMKTLFYRLKEVGLNGKSFYSNVVEVKRENLQKESVFFENPVTDKLTLQINSPVSTNLKIQIIDVLGRQMQTQNAKFDNDQNIYSMDVHTLSKGLYYLILSDNNNNRKQYNFIKQ